MNILYKLRRKRICKHNNTSTITNFSGDMINKISKAGTIYRSERICNECGLRFFSGSLDPECKVINYKREDK